MIKKHITVTEQQEQWMQTQIAAGLYADDSELLQALIAQAQYQDDDVELVRTKLIKAESLGISAMTPHQIMEDVLRKKRESGELLP